MNINNVARTKITELVLALTALTVGPTVALGNQSFLPPSEKRFDYAHIERIGTFENGELCNRNAPQLDAKFEQMLGVARSFLSEKIAKACPGSGIKRIKRQEIFANVLRCSDSITATGEPGNPSIIRRDRGIDFEKSYFGGRNYSASAGAALDVECNPPEETTDCDEQTGLRTVIIYPDTKVAANSGETKQYSSYDSFDQAIRFAELLWSPHEQISKSGLRPQAAAACDGIDAELNDLFLISVAKDITLETVDFPFKLKISVQHAARYSCKKTVQCGSIP